MDGQAPKKSTPPLQSLPEKILSSVCSYLPQGALYQLTLVNKHVNQFVVPVLYSFFCQNGGDSMQVRQYFRTAVREPELAKHLREVTIQGSIRIIHKQVRKCLRKLDKESWVHRLHEHHLNLAYDYFSYGPDLVIALLLSLEPKIYSIRALHPPNPRKKGHIFRLPIYLEPIRGILAGRSALPQWTNGILTDFTALTELEVHYSHVADNLLPPNLCRLIVRATTRDKVCIMKDMEILAQEFSKRSNLSVTLKYRHYKKPDHKCPKLRKLPSMFAKSGLNLSLYVYPVVGSTWHLISRFDTITAWQSQGPTEFVSNYSRTLSKRLDSTYDCRKIMLEEIKSMVGKHENF
ncbi:hypothetical protein BKA58DRAFT_440186 [Alternaria rosae]|uniref:uncharacterized protein n=1 Tax=Alternaria rosae TaxID=1187941 RepID=UPI001E8CE63B|nr:uncharacterized protein BKA58DRAFT_440186 [Alternaria rosae]KAH6870645.1 hypothetical protein BKA58DRAFT_440186 [Alternaria rosae]